MNFVSLFIIIVSVIFPFQQEEEKIAWNQNNKLTWSDFKSSPNISNDYVASTSSGISFSYKFSYTEDKDIIDLKVSVTSYFYPEKSWFIPSEVSEYILNHEQTHFDISELHARHLRKKISETTFSKNIKKEIEAIYNTIEERRRNMQYAFDNESDHSKIKDKELEWEAYIAQQLKEYETWK